MLRVAIMAEKPAMAPTIIMPSTPRLSTPARSVTNSPEAARSSGVAEIMAPIRMLATRSMGLTGRAGNERTANRE
jgi:hypothetical protein